MKKGREFLALDIGSARIKALACEARRDGTLKVSSLFVMPSRGMRRGMVDDVAEVAGAVNQALVEIRKESPNAHKAIFVNIASAYVKAQTSRGIVAVSRADYQIHHDDIMRVEAAAQAMNIPPNRSVVHLINQEYIVDGITGIKDPLGMVGNRLELVSMIVDVFEPAVKSLKKAIETAGGEVEGMIFGSLASGRSVLTRNQKDLGVAIVAHRRRRARACAREPRERRDRDSVGIRNGGGIAAGRSRIAELVARCENRHRRPRRDAHPSAIERRRERALRGPEPRPDLESHVARPKILPARSHEPPDAGRSLE